jgi:protein-L-isoaspartate(D-aspartate) O-methyltransferase
MRSERDSTSVAIAVTKGAVTSNAINSFDAALSAERRARMVETQLRARGIRDERVLAAMGGILRERFVPVDRCDMAYDDSPLPIGEGQTISQPYMVAVTCQSARLSGHERVLDVGSGSGYQAAVLSRLAREVVSIERVPELAENARRRLEEAGIEGVEVVLGDGTLGFLPRAPYDAIVVAAAAPSVPPALIDQLAVGGRLVIPIGPRSMQRLRAIEKLDDHRLRELDGDACVYVPLIGAAGYAPD